MAFSFPTPSDEFNDFSIFQHDSAVDFLAVAYPTLQQHEHSSNIVLAHALNRAPAEYVLTACQFLTDGEVQLPSLKPPRRASNFWLTVWSSLPNAKPVLEIVLSCLHWELGNYPIFLWTPVDQSRMSSRWLAPRTIAIAMYLHSCVDSGRIFSVFGTKSLTNSFAGAWSKLTRIEIALEPMYTCFFLYCTPQSLTPSTSDAGGKARRATISDLHMTARLCQEFTDDSYYPLSISDATIEAQQLIHRGQLWVYETTTGEIASICAVARTSWHVSAITKVYTTPKWRRNGFGQDLVREVTRLLFKCGKHGVVLYVGCDNGAQRIYGRVGFLRELDVEICSELGFVGLDRGHW
ncbi:hypothetical protein C8J57DRAFT_15008 [Mycena rebaudengoi]|nr:hypothetical protein C8J57DRAFT_15008 [Mycena rebaudengoi]